MVGSSDPFAMSPVSVSDISAESGLEPVSQTIILESDLADWLKRHSRKVGASPSVIIATLLEWARDEDILEGDPAFFPELGRRRPKRRRIPA